MTKEFIDFVLSHENEDTARLLLSAARYPDIDIPAAVQQIEGRRAAKEKWPGLLQQQAFLYPPRLNREQASSEETASHKASLLARLCGPKAGCSVADLTGGMGVDSIAFAQCPLMVGRQKSPLPTQLDYVERSEELCLLMEHNRKALGLENLRVHCGDSMKWLAEGGRHFDVLFIDPARRSASGRKVAAFEDCQPNILQHMAMLHSHCRWLIVKASPMIDIDLGCRQLGDVAEVHIVSVRGECKEVLFVCGRHEGETVMRCVMRGQEGESVTCHFTRSEEAAAEPRYCTAPGRYLYEPDAALMKAGPFNLLSRWLDIEKLGRNSHLYTSDELRCRFYGRSFEVLKELTRKELPSAIPGGRAHVVVRNYPVEAAVLQRRLGLKEGGELFVVATTVGTRMCLLLCRRVGEGNPGRG